MLIVKNTIIAVIGKPSKQGRIYDMTLFDSFYASGDVPIFKDVSSVSAYNISDIIGFGKNPRMNDGHIICDLSLLNEQIFYYDMILENKIFANVVVIGGQQYEECVTDARLYAFYLGDRFGWNLNYE